MPADDIYELVVDGIKCSPEHTHILTPMEFGALVSAFFSYDIERTGSVDSDTFKTISYDLKMGYTSEKLDELMADLNIDEFGNYAFEELCRLAVIQKTGPDNKMHNISMLLSNDKTTPFVELHRQAAARNLKIKFFALDIRETSDVGLPVHVSEVGDYVN